MSASGQGSLAFNRRVWDHARPYKGLGYVRKAVSYETAGFESGSQSPFVPAPYLGHKPPFSRSQYRSWLTLTLIRTLLLHRPLEGILVSGPVLFDRRKPQPSPALG